jgi:malic enzyme
VLIDNIKDFAPIIYTPTVGLVCENYSGLFSAKDSGEMMSMIYNWPQENVRLFKKGIAFKVVSQVYPREVEIVGGISSIN